MSKFMWTMVSFWWIASNCGCADLKYTPIVRVQIPPTENAIAITGEVEGFVAFAKKSQMPHNSPREMFRLRIDATHELTAQLGADDYVLIGEIIGRGGSIFSLGDIQDAIVKRSSEEGGHIVMFYGAGYTEQAYSYTTPGHSTTNVYGSSLGSSRTNRISPGVYNSVYGSSFSATARSTFTPAQTYSGVHRFPYASAFVFRHVPGSEKIRQTALSLNNEGILNYLVNIDIILQDDTLDINQAYRKVVNLLDSIN